MRHIIFEILPPHKSNLIKISFELLIAPSKKYINPATRGRA